MATKRLPAEQRRKQILKCAIRVFAQKGYHGATTKAISQEAGVAEALLYRYFGNKQGLFTDAVERTSQKLVDGLETAFGANQDRPAKAMKDIFSFYTDLLVKQRDFAKMIFLVFAELDDPEIREIYLPHQKRALRIISTAIARWQEKGILRADLNAKASAWLLIGGFQVLALVKHSGHLDQLDPAVALELARPFLADGGPLSE